MEGGVWTASLQKKRYTQGAIAFNSFIAKLSWYKPYKNTLHIAKINYIKLEIKNTLHRNVMYLNSFLTVKIFKIFKPSSTTPGEKLFICWRVNKDILNISPLRAREATAGSEVLWQDVCPACPNHGLHQFRPISVLKAPANGIICI